MIKPSLLIEKLENTESLLSFRTKTNLLIWPLVRHDIISSIINSHNNLNYAYSQKQSKVWSILKVIVQSIIKTPLLIKKNKIIFFSSGITNIKSNNGFFFNRVTDPFYFKLSKDASLIEDTAMGILRSPRIHKDVYPHFFLIGVSKLFGVFKRVSKEDLISIKKLTNEIISILNEIDLDPNFQIIYDIQKTNLKRYYSQINTYKWFFKLKKPKAIFLEDASYGNKSFILIAAKALNIPVIELQHGFVNEDHIAYNLGNGLQNMNEMKLYFPDYFFTYGDFWKHSINIPSKIVSIGNPYLNQQINEIISINSQVRSLSKVLFLSSGVSVKESIDFLRELKKQSDKHKYEVILRVHPFEVNIVESRYGELISLGVKISENNSLYTDFINSDIIIGEMSTALFESLAVPEKKHFLFMSAYTKSYYNENIKIPKVYQNTIEDVFIKGDVTHSNIDYFWKKDWECSFDLALTKILNCT